MDSQPPDPVPTTRAPALTGEAGRLAVLALVGAWLLHPFMTGRLVGTGDALWYANMLADFVTQWRAGVFPVFVGQTEYAFNGAVYPLRVAPLYQHLAGLIDLLTGRSLGFFALQHATVLACGYAGLLASYLTLRRLAPARPWTAVAGATLYLSCPGVLGTIYTQDLYMTWMTVPFLPLAVYGIVRPCARDDVRSQLWLAAPLAALWHAHSPVALWMTLIAAGTQGLRLVFLHRHGPAWRRALLGAGVFVALAHYPFVSVASLNVPGAASAVTAGLTEQERITNVIREVFPAVLKPLSHAAGNLSDLQLGYSLWMAGLVILAVSFRRGTPLAIRALAGAGLLLVLLLLPVPGLTDWLWAHLPEPVKRITFYWPMHRFYLLLAALLTGAGALALAALQDRHRHGTSRSPESIEGARLASSALAGFQPFRHSVLPLVLLLACAWSLWEARQFVRAGKIRTATAEITARSQRPENLLLMNHAYGLLPALPAYFSNGVMDPRAEVRLLDQAGAPLPFPAAHAQPPQDRFIGVLDANPGVLKLTPSLRLEPGKRYELEFAFPDREIVGILQLAGATFFREYALPRSGQLRAFGSGPDNARTLPLWTTSTAPEEVTLRFIPQAPGARPADFADFARYRLRETPPRALPVEVTSLVPFRATVRAPEGGALLETPRMFLPGYTADAGGRTVEAGRSAQGLATVAVPEGCSEVTLSYRAPLSVRLSYWTALLTWPLLLMAGAVSAWRTRPGVSPN